MMDVSQRLLLTPGVRREDPPHPQIDKLPLKGATGFTAVRDIWYNMSIYAIPDFFCHSSPRVTARRWSEEGEET